jgi:hypothetical protein
VVRGGAVDERTRGVGVGGGVGGGGGGGRGKGVGRCIGGGIGGGRGGGNKRRRDNQPMQTKLGGARMDM